MKLGVAVDFHLVVQAERPQEEEERGLLVDRFLAKPATRWRFWIAAPSISASWKAALAW